MQYPKISIITPSYNQGQFLEATILSVLDQHYPNLEYIIIDGGSTDNSVEIIKKYQDRLTYWVSEKDAGQTDAINKGIRRSSGEIIGWINSDDTYVRGAFLKVANAFLKHPDCIVVHGDRILIDARGQVIGWAYHPPFDPTKHGYSICSETAFWRSEASQRYGELKTEMRFAMDLEFFCRLYQNGKFHKINQFLGRFRCHDDSKSSTIWEVALEEGVREWKAIFGAENESYKVVPKYGRLLNILVFLRNPWLVALPYSLSRLRRLIRR